MHSPRLKSLREYWKGKRDIYGSSISKKFITQTHIHSIWPYLLRNKLDETFLAVMAQDVELHGFRVQIDSARLLDWSPRAYLKDILLNKEYDFFTLFIFQIFGFERSPRSAFVVSQSVSLSVSLCYKALWSSSKGFFSQPIVSQPKVSQESPKNPWRNP